jgi:lipopolysaccharide transport system ATP-binding protein
MSSPVIKVENLSKQYRLGAAQGYKTFREAIVKAAKPPLNRLKQIFGSSDNDDNAMHHTLSSSQSPNGDLIWALKDASFEVKQGEVVGIIGRNGAGKSTLLKILSKITEPTNGRVELRGRVGSLLEVGTGFHPELTGHENIYLYGAILGMDRWEVSRKFDEIVDFAELEKFIDTPVKRYSSGMYMRLAFAVAAHLESETLLIDEVLAVGDSAFQKRCLDKMGDVSKEGRTVLFVSHNMAAISALCSRAIIFDKGSKEFDGPAVESIRRYMESAQELSAEWVAEVQMTREGASLQAVRVKDSSGRMRTQFSNQESVVVEMDVHIPKWFDDLKVGFELEGDLGSTVFSTFHNDVFELLHQKDFQPGVYMFQTTIPPRLLNGGTFFVAPCAGIHRRRWMFRQEKAVLVKIEFQTDNPAYLVKNRPGIVGPLLEWETRRVDEICQ